MKITKVTNESEYQEAQNAIETYLAKGVNNLTQEEDDELYRVSLLNKAYDSIYHPMPVEPPTLAEMIRLRMFQQKLKQRDVAKLLAISETRLSEVLSGKRRVNMDLAKRLYGQLNIRAEYILEKA